MACLIVYLLDKSINDSLRNNNGLTVKQTNLIPNLTIPQRQATKMYKIKKKKNI